MQVLTRDDRASAPRHPQIMATIHRRHCYEGQMAAKKLSTISQAMMGTLEKTLKEIVQDSVFNKVASQRLSLSSAEIDTRLSIGIAITSKCWRAVVALCALRARALASRNTTTEAAMTAWVELLNNKNKDILEWIMVGATPTQMTALQRYGITPKQVGKYLGKSDTRGTITKLIRKSQSSGC